MWKKRMLQGLGAFVLFVVLFVGFFVYRMFRDEGKFPMLMKDTGYGKKVLLRRVDIYPGFGKTLLRSRNGLIENGNYSNSKGRNDDGRI